MTNQMMQFQGLLETERDKKSVQWTDFPAKA
jgi:hypothetical protein